MNEQAVQTDPKVMEVAAGVMLRADGSVLLGQRPAGKAYAGWWELPGGKLEPGETVLQALARELKEELGIEVTAATPWVTHEHTYPHATVRLHFCRVTGWHGEPQGLESQDVQWVQAWRAETSAISAAVNAREARIAALAPDATPEEHVGATAMSVEEALGLTLLPPVAPLLPATLPPMRWLQVPDIYGITDIRNPEHLPVFLSKLDSALHRGLRLVQFRERDWPEGPDAPSLLAVLRDVIERTHAAGGRVLVNSVHPAAWWHEADGVHLRASDAGAARPDIAPGSWVGVSAHAAHDLANARRLDADFVVLGHVLDTPSHSDRPALGWERFTELNAQAGLPVFALGGQGADTLATAIACGAHGIAAIRGVWEE